MLPEKQSVDAHFMVFSNPVGVMMMMMMTTIFCFILVYLCEH